MMASRNCRECRRGSSVKVTFENLRGNVEKLSPKDSVESADTVLRGSVRALEEISEGKHKAAKPRGRSPQGFAAEQGFSTVARTKIS